MSFQSRASHALCANGQILLETKVTADVISYILNKSISIGIVIKLTFLMGSEFKFKYFCNKTSLVSKNDFNTIIITNSYYYLVNKPMLKKANDLLYNSQYEQAVQQYNRIIASAPQKDILLAAYYNQAQAYDSMGQYSSSAQSYQRIIDIDPQFKKGEIYYEVGQVYQLGRMHPQCKKAYSKFLEYYPKHAECYFNLGQVLQALGEQEQAVRCYDKACENRSNYSKAYLNKISILKKLKRFQQILKTCSQALHNQPTDFQILYEQGFALVALQRYKQAIESLKECIRNNKRCVRAYIGLGDCYYKTQKESVGLQTLSRCLQENKDVIKMGQKKQIKMLMGTIFMSRKEYKNAIDCFTQIINQRPVLENVKIKLAYCFEEYGHYFFQKKQFSDALKCYQESIKYQNRRNSLINSQGLAYQNINNFQMAEKCFNSILQKQPKNPIALNNIASLYRQMGRTQKSNQILQSLSKQNLGNAQIHINSGRNYLTLHKYSEAYAQFQKALGLDNKSSNYNLYNDLAVTLQKLNRNEQALVYANKANELTNNRSPLILLNRASILMNLQKIAQAKQDFESAALQLRAPDKQNLNRLGVNVDNLKYMFNQLNHYAYLMTPINDFRREIINQISKMPQNPQVYNKVVEKVQKAEEYAMSRIITEIKKDNPRETPNPQESRQDYNTINKFMQEAKQLIEQQKKSIKNLQQEVKLLKHQSNEIKQRLRYLPQSINLKVKLQQLYNEGNMPIWQYGKQLYWILNGYLKGYMLISAGIVGKGENVNHSTFSQSLKTVTSISQFAKNIPVIGQFSELIGKVCGLLVDMQDDAIIEKMYQIISYNYDTQEDLNDQICESVLIVLNTPYKIAKIRENLVFKPSQGLLGKLKQKFEDISSWFSQKKNQFIMHMRGFQKSQSILQSQLAIIDVGAIISILLNMESNPNSKSRVIRNAAKRMSIGDEMQKMVFEAYQRQNENLRVSNHSFCNAM